MSGRHGAGARRSPVLMWGAVAAAAVVVVAGGYFAVTAVGAGESGCETVERISVAVDPTLAPVVSDALAATDVAERGCAEFEVRAEAPTDTATELANSDAERPDLWIPDSTLWLLKTLR
ncbi:MAG: hypothetical protein WBG14_22010, partial [Rhodococcus sp. (in: high G+C Gram-positive bacteria)]